MDSIVVTGATSMLGVATIGCALEKGVRDVYAVVRPNSWKVSLLPNDGRVHTVECELGRYDTLRQMVDKPCDSFVHLAWSGTENRNADPLTQSHNISYTLEAARAAKELGCNRFVGAGSQAEYGPLGPSHPTGPNHPVNPIGPYGISTLAAGRLVLEETRDLDMGCAWMRIFSVYGEGDRKGAMVPSAVKRLMKGEPTSFTPGTQLWDYLHCEDAGRALLLAAEGVCGQKVYCLGSGKARPLAEFIREMRDVLRPGLPDERLGIGLVPEPDQVTNLWADVSALNSDFGWTPTVGFSEGIRRLAKSFDDVRRTVE